MRVSRGADNQNKRDTEPTGDTFGGLGSTVASGQNLIRKKLDMELAHRY